MDIVIYHNPDCGTSRNVLRIIQDAGYEPLVVEYLKVGWTVEQLTAIFSACGLTPREALRTTKSPAEALGLLSRQVPDDEMLALMVEHPILVNRPIVVTGDKTKLCRPSGVVLDLLDQWPAGPYHKEDGTLLIDADGNKVAD